MPKRSGSAAVVFLAMCMLATSAHALGLGAIHVRSGLGQPFSAAIPLHVDSASDLDGLTVGLADPAAFRRAGVVASGAVQSLHFAVDAKHSPAQIVVTSERPISEPFLNFLVNVRWNGGTLQREYTVLLNPANYGTQAAFASSAAPVSEAVVPETIPPEVTRRAEYPEVVPAPVRPSRIMDTARPRARPATSTVAPAAAAQARASGFRPGAARRRVGPIKVGQTFWSIAEQVRPDASITMDQVLLSIYDANRAAFSAGRFNGLMKGAVLRVPSAEQMHSTSPEVAAARVAALRAKAGERVTRRGTALAPAAVTRARPAAVRPLRVPAPASSTAPSAAPVAAADQAATRDQSQVAASARQQGVGAGLASLPASGASATEGKPGRPGAEVGPQPAVTAGHPAQKPGITRSSVDALAAPAAAGLTARGIASGAPAAAVSSAGASGAAAGTAAVRNETRHAVGVKPSADAYQAVAHEPPRAATSPFSTLLDSVDWRYVVIIVLLALLFMALAIRRRQRSGAASAAPRTPPVGKGAASAPRFGVTATPRMSAQPATAGAAVVGAVAASVVAPPAGGAMNPADSDEELTRAAEELAVGASGDNLASANGFESVAATDAVPVSDADDSLADAEFHLAYGLYDEAIPLLKQAAAQYPARTDISLKLEQAYYGAGQADAFEALARTLQGKIGDAEWQDLAEKGRKLCPGVALFEVAAVAGGAQQSTHDVPDTASAEGFGLMARPAAGSTDAGVNAAGTDTRLLSTPGAAEAPRKVPAPEAPGDSVIEFDAEPAGGTETHAGAERNGIEVPVAEGLAATTEVGARASELRDAHADAHSVDFDLSRFDEEPVGGSLSPRAADSGVATLDLGPLDFDLKGEVAAEAENASALAPPSPVTSAVAGHPASVSDAMHVLDFDGAVAPDTAGQPLLRSTSTPEDLVPGPDTTTQPRNADLAPGSLSVDYAGKLDLAQIYAAMGENDAAREVIAEILKNGGAEHRAAAEALLRTLAD